MRILVVEDDSVLADAIVNALGDAGYAADALASGADADRALGTEEFDLVILDIELPMLDGYEVLERLRARGRATPVLILTARDSVLDRIHGLDTGADDYLTKPFVMGELYARVRALIRRAKGRAENRIVVGQLEIDVTGRTATLGSAPLELSAKELAAIEVLATRAGKVVSKDVLMNSVYAWDRNVGPNAVEILIHRIRKKLQDSAVSIRTVRGLGYLMESGGQGAEEPRDAG